MSQGFPWPSRALGALLSRGLGWDEGIRSKLPVSLKNADLLLPSFFEELGRFSSFPRDYGSAGPYITPV